MKSIIQIQPGGEGLLNILIKSMQAQDLPLHREKLAERIKKDADQIKGTWLELQGWALSAGRK
jgi:hypothetical protein